MSPSALLGSRLALCASISLVLALGGCTCPPAPRPERIVGQNFATPENAIEYFRAAWELADKDGATQQQYLFFSETLKRESKELTLFNYAQGKDEVRAVIEKEIGNLESIEIDDWELVEERPYEARVSLLSGEREATVRMIQETTYSVTWQDPDIEESSGLLPPGTNPLSLKGRSLALELAVQSAEGATAADVYEVRLERAWKFLGFEDGATTRRLMDSLEESKRKKAEENKTAPKTPRG